MKWIHVFLPRCPKTKLLLLPHLFPLRSSRKRDFLFSQGGFGRSLLNLSTDTNYKWKYANSDTVDVTVTYLYSSVNSKSSRTLFLCLHAGDSSDQRLYVFRLPVSMYILCISGTIWGLLHICHNGSLGLKNELVKGQGQCDLIYVLFLSTLYLTYAWRVFHYMWHKRPLVSQTAMHVNYNFTSWWIFSKVAGSLVQNFLFPSTANQQGNTKMEFYTKDCKFGRYKLI